MGKVIFNLDKFTKKAFYEGGKGLIAPQTRAMMNCTKIKRDKGMSAQEAWNSCIEEYNNNKKNDWSSKYS